MKKIFYKLIQLKVIKEKQNIASSLNLKFSFFDLKKLIKHFINAYEIDNNLIYFHPINDGMPTCPFEFYKNGEKVIDNHTQYIQISNLDDILLQMVRVFNQSLDDGILLSSYDFMLELTGDIKENYQGEARLVITKYAIRNPDISKEAFHDAQKYFINEFLDHFIGWNFGVSVNRNETLKRELEELNSKVIEMGIREWAGPGFEVHGNEEFVNNGLQHYRLPTTNSNVRVTSR